MVVTLITTESSHFEKFFEFESDPIAVEMAAFAALPKDWESFSSMWQRRIENPVSIHRTILLDGKIVGGIMSYEMENHRHLGYWIDRNHWGKGIATNALKLFLEIETTRPLYATCVADNIGSRRTLEKNEFTYTHTENHHAPARNKVVDEVCFELK